ncbi:MAG: hypothetical protein KAJ19_07615, partial [Gammaproteobacteria bacterium]|nr:hypothetical protein [Gammaproteobacteria bacterium]
MKGYRLLLVYLLMFQCVSAVLAESSQSNLKLEPEWSYFGGGVGVSAVKGLAEDESMLQFFLGRSTPWIGRHQFAIEAGFAEISDIKSDGLWVSGAVLQQLQPDIDLTARAGFDLGDDPGLLFGVGVAYTMERNMQVRL